MHTKILFATVALLMVAAPALASADIVFPPTELTFHQTAIAAALATGKAAQAGSTFACALAISKKSVAIDEPFVLAWSSIGAMNPGDDPTNNAMWTHNDAEFIALPSAGSWTYNFVFYAKNGATTRCQASIFVHA